MDIKAIQRETTAALEELSQCWAVVGVPEAERADKVAQLQHDIRAAIRERVENEQVRRASAPLRRVLRAFRAQFAATPGAIGRGSRREFGPLEADLRRRAWQVPFLAHL